MPKENHISIKKSRSFRDYFREPLYLLCIINGILSVFVAFCAEKYYQ